MQPVKNRALNAILNTKYKDITELRASRDGLVFSLSNAITGNCFIYEIKSKEVPQPTLVKRFAEPIRSSLNDYGASPFCVDARTSNIYAIQKSKIVLIPGNREKEPHVVVDEPTFRFGDPCSVGDYLYVVADTPEGQGIVRYKKHDLFNLPPEEVKTEVIDMKESYFYGGIVASPQNCRIAYNRWCKGMAFDSAEVVINNVVKPKLFVTIRMENACLLFPQFITDHLVIYLAETEQHTAFYMYSTKKGRSIVYNCGKSDDVDVGDPYWIVGNQRYYIVTSNYVVYHTEGKLNTYQRCGECIRSIPISNVDLLFVDFHHKDTIYFKTDGPLKKQLFSLNVNAPELSPKLLFEIPCDFDSVCIPERLKNTTTKGLLYQIFSPQTLSTRPMIIWLHGGPAMRVHNTIDLRKQAYIEAGFNIFELEYTGSGGYGRVFRNALYGNWGIADVEDVLECARELIRLNVARAGEIFLIGSSAGGFLALGALAADQNQLIKAAAVSSGFSNAADLLQVSCPFEHSYTENLLPENPPAIVPALVKKKANIAFFHGDNDPVVPYDDVRHLYEDLRKREAKSVFYVLDGEGHGFKKAENVCFVINETVDFFKAF